jgi:hypothetical protein
MSDFSVGGVMVFVITVYVVGFVTGLISGRLWRLR